ncbi:TetR/AcrR family transcriptional regulator [Novosphingobium album (ex Hu et al. 2023)]|uniref:TetR/AcrR family transcriptional regulator n=1 Tax=Novosphingobium album (ex Hu et al. 2023) TaxID=2930093 RepID=A0ABT0B5Y1_9SPHN|nr:TetR/AcrR family transcriptional regulator [Novosphingobium album (ex Hu et al. 2023)]MCJ2180258.1 TetR/AcrR family transcriptional regulator [Novosphingobium album (ex Hu et al. 2023)]
MARRRFGTKSSETRAQLLDLAEQLMRDEGYAAITSRRLGSFAGLSPQIVYYYFKTMDELFEALLLRIFDAHYAALDEAGSADDPLLAMWLLSCDPARATITAELMALANHRKDLSSLIGKFNEKFSARQIEILDTEFAARGIEFPGWPIEAIAAVMENTARGFAFGRNYELANQIDAQLLITRYIESLRIPSSAVDREGQGG